MDVKGDIGSPAAVTRLSCCLAPTSLRSLSLSNGSGTKLVAAKHAFPVAVSCPGSSREARSHLV